MEHEIIKAWSVKDRNVQVGWWCSADDKGWTLDEKAKADQHAKEANAE